MKLPYLEVNQPIGTFYMVSVPSSVLLSMVEVRRHDMKSFDKVQRELSEKRVSEIGKFCQEADAVFPTAIVVSVDKKIPYTIDLGTHTIYFPDNVIVGDVIDGQHRLWGIKKSNREEDFELPVVLMFDLEIAEKAYVFSIINSTQTKVNKSLIYNLFGLSPTRSPYKTCHEIARALNSKEGSPFYNRMKMLGKKGPGQAYASLSQGTFVKQLLKLISSNPDDDTRLIKQEKSLAPYAGLPMRDWFIANQDEVILRILENCFSALKKTFYEEWLHPGDNILWKTTGFCGVMLALNSILRLGLQDMDLTVDFFMKIFGSFKTYTQQNGISLTSKSFPGGGEQNQKRLCRMIVASISDSVILDSKNVSKEFASFIRDISMDLSIHEKYELANILRGETAGLNFFTVVKANDHTTINYPIADTFITIPSAQLLLCLKQLENLWFDGNDADTWYGFELSLDKDD